MNFLRLSLYLLNFLQINWIEHSNLFDLPMMKSIINGGAFQGSFRGRECCINDSARSTLFQNVLFLLFIA